MIGSIAGSKVAAAFFKILQWLSQNRRMGVKRVTSALIDRIYEAAALPELWPSVLDQVNDVGGGFATFLLTATSDNVQWTYSARGSVCEDYMAEGWPAKTDRPFRLLAARHAGFLGDLDVYTREEMDREPVFTEFMRPRGLGWGAATAVEVPSGNTLIFNVERRWETGPVDSDTIKRLDELRPRNACRCWRARKHRQHNSAIWTYFTHLGDVMRLILKHNPEDHRTFIGEDTMATRASICNEQRIFLSLQNAGRLRIPH